MNSSVSIGAAYTEKVNFAIEQNGVPLIRNISITNGSTSDLVNLRMNVTFNPGFAMYYACDIKRIPAGETVTVGAVNIVLNAGFFFALEEKKEGTVKIELVHGEETICSRQDNIILFGRKEWLGLGVSPQLIATYVTPDKGVLDEVISDKLFTGYNLVSPETVRRQIEAIYSSLMNLQISFNGMYVNCRVAVKNINFINDILDKKVANDLEFALLYTSSLEAAGLYPVLIFSDNGIYAACHVEEESFADYVIEDKNSIVDRLKHDKSDLLVINCTDYAAGKNISFEEAVDRGRESILNMDNFIIAIDIRRARQDGIKPVKLNINQLFESTEDYGYADANTENMTKIQLWERKLLDLSLRNALLNFRPSKNSLELHTDNPAMLEDKLARGEDIIVSETEDNVRLEDNKVSANALEGGINDSLKKIYRSAKVNMEENGSNTLFLAMGFLKWYDTETREKERYAPLILIPVDIVRNVRGSGYLIRGRQEESQINITLLEYLRQDYGITVNGLNPLPEDDNGIDIPLVFNIVKQAVEAKEGWQVCNKIYLGLFSFGQFVMWNDLKMRKNDLEKNKVVESLIKGARTWSTDSYAAAFEQIEEPALENMAVPLSADSSQLRAIKKAAEGESFVLHGPPGTGKSQTITNMIANALYQGKSVLFVAEKMTALSVVWKRLCDIGLEPFCLELHSNKTNKQTVLEKLEKTLEFGRMNPPGDYNDILARLSDTKHKLSDIMEAVHMKRECGMSFYEAVEKYQKFSGQRGSIDIPIEMTRTIYKKDLDKWKEAIRTYSIAMEQIGVYAHCPITGIGVYNFSATIREHFFEDIQFTVTEGEKASYAFERLSDRFGITRQDKRAVYGIAAVARAGMLPGMVLKDLLYKNDYAGTYEKAEKLADVGIEYLYAKSITNKSFDDRISEYNARESKARWDKAKNQWFLPRHFKTRKLIKELRKYAKNSVEIDKNNIEKFYEILCNAEEKREILSAAPSDITNLFGSLYGGLNSAWRTVKDSLHKTDIIKNSHEYFDSSEMSIIISKVDERNERESVATWGGQLDEYLKRIDVMCQKYTLRINKDNEDNYLREVGIEWNLYLNHIGDIKNIINFNKADLEICNAGLSCVSEAYKKGAVTAENVVESFECNLYYHVILAIIENDERLSGFSGKQYDDIINILHETISMYQKVTKEELVARVSANVPIDGGEFADTSEMGILKKAIKNKGRSMPLRKLFNQTPALMRKLCPCMLMSPISVAQYIDSSFPKFDLVIFDEASQIPTSEAVGAIARAENAVIVGDSRQLPPTSFFASAKYDDANADIEDLESLLDDCLAISVPEEHLNWHYRSRHESLIAYSNAKYYDNRLYTFPSPDGMVSAVSLVHVDGVYDKGKTKQNEAEAKAVVDEVIRRLSDEKLRKDSIGVVTFSQVQQNLIDDMLEEEFANHPELDQYNSSLDEPVFVKNLENVQGDERDIILFSVGYGPDENGNVAMNFGPLNKEGGERRLNVAITRARKKMIVYAVLRPEQIDLSRTHSRGVAGLKGFLEYAARRGSSIDEINASSVKDEVTADTLIEDIASEIRKMGYQTKCNVGNSEYKVDIAVVSPNSHDKYILGIIMDGKNSMKMTNVTDRYVIWTDVMEGLAWNLIRVWSMDWFDNAQNVLAQIKNAIEEAVSVENDNMYEEPEIPVINVYNPSDYKPVFEKANDTLSIYKTDYVSAVVESKGTSEDYFEEVNFENVVSVVEQITETEAPISKNVLERKTLAAWGIRKSGMKEDEIFDKAIQKLELLITLDNERKFVWKKGAQPERIALYRVDDQFGNRRNIEDIPSEEIMVAVKEVLTSQISIQEQDLIKEVSRKFGFPRVGNIIENTILIAITKGLERKEIKIAENGKITL